MSVEYVANALLEYHHGKMTEEMMIVTLRKQLNSLKYRAANIVRHYVPLLPETIQKQKQEAGSSSGHGQVA